MRDVDTNEIVEQHAAEMGCRARAGRAVLHLVLIGLGIGNEFRKISHRQVLARKRGIRRFCRSFWLSRSPLSVRT
jgi:hypothetical protein